MECSYSLEHQSTVLEHDDKALEHSYTALGYDGLPFDLTLKDQVKGFHTQGSYSIIMLKGLTVMLKDCMIILKGRAIMVKDRTIVLRELTSCYWLRLKGRSGHQMLSYVFGLAVVVRGHTDPTRRDGTRCHIPSFALQEMSHSRRCHILGGVTSHLVSHCKRCRIPGGIASQEMSHSCRCRILEGVKIQDVSYPRKCHIPGGVAS